MVAPSPPLFRTAFPGAGGGRGEGEPRGLVERRGRAELKPREILHTRYAEAFELRGGLGGRICYGLICNDVIALLSTPRGARGHGWCGVAEYQYEVRFRSRCERWGIEID